MRELEEAIGDRPSYDLQDERRGPDLPAESTTDVFEKLCRRWPVPRPGPRRCGGHFAEEALTHLPSTGVHQHSTTIYGAISRGDIPVVRVGRKMLVPTAWIRRVMGLDQPAA